MCIKQRQTLLSLGRTSSIRTLHAFTLVEIMIVVFILGILAALVVPRFSNASSIASASALRNDLRYMRTQVMVYRAQHGVSPGYPNGDTSIAPNFETLVAQLTQYTNESGVVSDVAGNEHRYGPYMQQLPVNPVNNSREVRFIATGAPLPAGPSGTEGWIYQPSTALVLANVQGADETGVKYFDY